MEPLNFKEFYLSEITPKKFNDIEVANLYFHNSGMTVRELARTTSKSIGEIYRILRIQGEPNRRHSNHHGVLALADSGLPSSAIGEFTGYTGRQVRNILKRHGR